MGFVMMWWYHTWRLW